MTKRRSLKSNKRAMLELRPRVPITRAELVMAALVIFPEGAELHVRGSWLLRRDLRKAGFIVHNDNLSARIWNAGKRCDDRQAGKCSRHFSAFMVVGSFTAVIQLHCWHSASLRAMREASLLALSGSTNKQAQAPIGNIAIFGCHLKEEGNKDV